MDTKFAFTQARIKTLPVPEKGRVVYYDTEIPKLACRVSSTGSKTFLVIKRFNGKVKNVTLGKSSDITVKSAQDLARIELSNMAQGIDSSKVKLKVLNLEETLEHYIKNRHPRNGRDLKPRTIHNYRSALNTSFSDWKNLSVQSITEAMVLKRYGLLTRTGVATANVGARVLRLTLKHAKTIGAVDAVATDILADKRAWNKEKRTERIIKMSDIKPWFESVTGLENERAKVYLLMMIFTGLRSSEAMNLRWSDVDFKKSTLTARDTKNGSDFTQFIPKQFTPYLKHLHDVTGHSQWVFSGLDDIKPMTIPKKPIARVIRETGVDFSPHDLRRSFAGYAEYVGTPFSVIKRLLNHADGSDVTLRYLITEDSTLASSIDKIGAFIMAKATEKDNVIKLHG